MMLIPPEVRREIRKAAEETLKNYMEDNAV